MTLDIGIASLLQQKRKSVNIACKDSSVKSSVLKLIPPVQEVGHKLHTLKVFF